MNPHITLYLVKLYTIYHLVLKAGCLCFAHHIQTSNPGKFIRNVGLNHIPSPIYQKYRQSKTDTCIWVHMSTEDTNADDTAVILHGCPISYDTGPALLYTKYLLNSLNAGSNNTQAIKSHWKIYSILKLIILLDRAAIQSFRGLEVKHISKTVSWLVMLSKMSCFTSWIISPKQYNSNYYYQLPIIKHVLAYMKYLKRLCSQI